MCWNSLTDSAWHSKALQKSTANLLLSSGIREKLAFKNKASRRCKFDLYLQSRGIKTIYHVNGFNGPSNIGHWDGSPEDVGLPGTMGPDGKISKRYAAPVPLLQSKKFSKLFTSYVHKAIHKQAESQCVVFDYEPWKWPEKMGFAPETISE